MTIGSNTESYARLQGFIERIETVRAEKKQSTLDEAQIIAEAKADGFHSGAIKAVLKIRTMKPHERQENEAILDTYLHAMGLSSEPPLFRRIQQMGVDVANRDAVIEAMQHLVPENGSITIETKDGKPVKLTRGKDGTVTQAEIVEPKAVKAGKGISPRQIAQKPDAPDVDEDGAEALGRMAFKANTPIIQNPFPFGDGRRGRWDSGWRKESGGDGMGPDREDD